MSNIDNYKKYLKYKKKYLLIKNQKGGTVCPICRKGEDCECGILHRLPEPFLDAILLHLSLIDLISVYRGWNQLEPYFQRNIKRIYKIFKDYRPVETSDYQSHSTQEIFDAMENKVYNMWFILWKSFLFVLGRTPFYPQPGTPSAVARLKSERESYEASIFLDYLEFAGNIEFSTFDLISKSSNLELYLLVSGFKVLYRNVNELIGDVVNISNTLKKKNEAEIEILFALFFVDKKINILKKLKPLFDSIEDFINFIVSSNGYQLLYIYGSAFVDLTDEQIALFLPYLEKYKTGDALIFSKYSLNEEQIQKYFELKRFNKYNPNEIIEQILNPKKEVDFGSWWS